MERSRAFRRHQQVRAVGRAARFVKFIGLEPTPKLVYRYAGQRKPCSCKMCRNPRWIEGATREELNAPGTGDWE